MCSTTNLLALELVGKDSIRKELLMTNIIVCPKCKGSSVSLSYYSANEYRRKVNDPFAEDPNIGKAINRYRCGNQHCDFRWDEVYNDEP